MRYSLVIAVLALLALMLLSQLDRYTGAEIGTAGLRLYLARLAHWINA